jgi:hypothetical protein
MLAPVRTRRNFRNLPSPSFGEYNLRFRYLDQVTPTIPIEIYNRLVKKAF